MNPQRILAIVDKEWTLTFRNWSVWFAILLPPAVVTALLLYVCQHLHFILVYVSQLLTQPDSIIRFNATDWSALLMDYFLMFFVALPAANATKFAASGIIADKSSRSLEPQLATPLTPAELIFSKVLAATLPPVLVAVTACGIFIHVAGRWGLNQGHLLGPTGSWFCLATILTMTLLLTNLLALLGFLIASRKTEARDTLLTATTFAQCARLFPPAGVFFGFKHQVAGTAWALEIIGLLLLANIILFFLSLALFQRETILFKWK